MKKMLCGVVCCLLMLTGCAKDSGSTPFDPSETTQALLDSGAFSETLEELDYEIAAMLFGLSGDAGQYEGTMLYYSTGATSETVAVVCARETDQTAAVEKALNGWVESQIEAVRNYQPDEVEKLEHAIVETRGNTVLLAVAADWEKARAAIPAE